MSLLEFYLMWAASTWFGTLYQERYCPEWDKALGRCSISIPTAPWLVLIRPASTEYWSGLATPSIHSGISIKMALESADQAFGICTGSG